MVMVMGSSLPFQVGAMGDVLMGEKI